MPEQTTVPVEAHDGSAKLRRREPGALFDDLQDEFARLWNRDWWLPPRGLLPLRFRRVEPLISTEAWVPRVDVFEKNGDLVVKAELPGVKKDDIHVEMDEGDLVIRGERSAESEVKEDDYYRMERSYGSFLRRLALPDGVDAGQVKATFTDGVLEVIVPKPVAAAKEPARIPVH